MKLEEDNGSGVPPTEEDLDEFVTKRWDKDLSLHLWMWKKTWTLCSADNKSNTLKGKLKVLNLSI